MEMVELDSEIWRAGVAVVVAAVSGSLVSLYV
jgi:hypothetical protein